MINCKRIKISIFNTTIFAFSILLISLVNTVIAQQQDSPNSLINNSGSSGNMSILSEDHSAASNVPPTSQPELNSLFNKLEKSVVSIAATLPANIDSETNANGLENSSNVSSNQSDSFGTGFVYDIQGHIITTEGVVTPGSSVQEVEFMDGTTYEAEVIGSDSYSDIAVLLVKGVPEGKLEPVEFINNSSDVLVGEQAATIGNSFDVIGLLSNGIISGLHKTFYLSQSFNEEEEAEVMQYPIVDAIVSTVVTNPGGAGGPLINMNGQVIGMNSAISSSSGEFTGVSIAIPSNTIKKVVPQIISTGTYEHPWLGIGGFDLTSDIASTIGLNDTKTKGALVIAVSPGSPAELAGLSEGTLDNNVDLGYNQSANADADIIVGIDSKPVTKMDDILELMNGKSIGDTIVLKILRNGEIQNTNVTLTGRH